MRLNQPQVYSEQQVSSGLSKLDSSVSRNSDSPETSEPSVSKTEFRFNLTTRIADKQKARFYAAVRQTRRSSTTLPATGVLRWGRTYAGILGPLAFTIVVARTLLGGGGVETTLLLASGCLFIFAGIGYVVGQIADGIVFQAVKVKFDEELEAREEAQAQAS